MPLAASVSRGMPAAASGFQSTSFYLLALHNVYASHRSTLDTTNTYRVLAAMIPPFETTFAVPLSCEDCIKDVSKSLYELEGINHNIHHQHKHVC